MNKESYKEIQTKKNQGLEITDDEAAYFADYQTYLSNYYLRMSDEEKEEFSTMQAQWDNESKSPQQNTDFDFSLRTKDRLINGVYGAYYGLSIVLMTEMEGGAAAGIPLIMAGVWQLGPVINPKKYDNISLATVRAGNSGKLLGLGYGASLGLALGGDNENTGKLALGLSTVGSIALGEIAFQSQKKKNLSEGHIDIMRHYGILGPGVTVLTYLAIDENSNMIGASLLAGGVAGLFLGNSVAKKYDYTSGDVDAISSLTLITTGIGFTVVAGSIEDDINRGLLLIPVASAIAGTVFGQRSVKGVHLTSRQGSTLNLATGGAALIGLGVVAITESDAPAVWVGVPTALALIMQQTLLHSYKRKNLENNFKLGKETDRPVEFSVKVNPENYFANKQISEKYLMANPELAFPIVKLKLVF